MNTSIDPTRFRRRLHRLLEPPPGRPGRIYEISSEHAPWAIIIRRPKVLYGVQVWYAANKGLLTLGLTNLQMRQAVPGDVRPDGSEEETSDKGWRMFRKAVPSLRLDVPPEEQEGAEAVVGEIEDMFEWLKSVRTDI